MCTLEFEGVHTCTFACASACVSICTCEMENPLSHDSRVPRSGRRRRTRVRFRPIPFPVLSQTSLRAPECGRVCNLHVIVML